MNQSTLFEEEKYEALNGLESEIQTTEDEDVEEETQEVEEKG